MFKIAICDDDTQQLESLETMLAEYGKQRPEVDLQVMRFLSISALEHYRKSHGGFTLMLLDIMMPEKSGMEYAHSLRQEGGTEVLVFITSSADFALDAFAVDALQYLIKPLQRDALYVVLDRALAQMEDSEARSIVVPNSGGMQRVFFHDIVYLECSYHQVFFHLSNGSCVGSRTIRQSFALYIEPMLTDRRFVRTHYSFVINLRYAARLNQRSIELYGGHTVPISKERHAQVKKSYFGFMDMATQG